MAAPTQPILVSPESPLSPASGVRSRRLVTYNLPPDPLWLRTASAISARLPRTWSQRLQQPRALVSVLLFVGIMAGPCAVLLAALIRVARGATGN